MPISVRGTFDDCQALVKAMFNDHGFRDRVSLAGVNSINWARIAGQVTYYFVAAAALGAPYRPVSFVVPTGNFGDIFAGYVAKRMGLPIERLVIASNVNDILPRTLHGGSYEMREVDRHDLAVDGHPDLLELRALSVRSLGPRRAADPRQDARAEGNGQLRSRLARRHHAPRVCGRGRERSRRRRGDRAHQGARCGYLADPHTACAIVAAERELGRQPRRRRSCCRPRIRRSSPTPCRRSPASGRRCPRGSTAC